MVPTRLSPLVWDRPQGHELHLGDRDRWGGADVDTRVGTTGSLWRR